MRYLAKTIADYIFEASKKPGTYKFIMPSYPSDVLVDIGNMLEKSFGNMLELKAKFLYGIAYRLGQRWQSTADRNFAYICQKGWYNQGNNLTVLRNEIKPPDIDILVTVLAGYEDIDDKGGLGDFYHMDQDSIWEICLEKSFKPWIESCLKDWINLDDHRSYINEIDDLFSSLYSNGLADLLTISFYLQNHDFSGVSSGSEAYRIILEDLKPFTLPKMTGLESKKTRKSFSTYQSAALQFFNYSTFLNAGSRNKALERLNAFRNDPQGPVPDAEQLGDFNDIDGLLDALQDYIENRSEEARQSLYSVDFIYLYEKVLGYKPKNKRTPLPTSKVRKLKGVAPEVFLHALWLTLADLRKETKQSGLYLPKSINKIMVRSILFKHNFNAGGDDDEHEEARQFLIQALGGIDDFLARLIRIPWQDSGDKEAYWSPITFEWQLSDIGNNNCLEYSRIRTGEPNLKFDIIIIYGEKNTLKREFVWVLPEHHQTRLMVDVFKIARQKYLEGGNLLPAFTVPYVSEVFMARDEEECTRLLQSALQKQCNVIDLLNVEWQGNTDVLKNHLERISYDCQSFLDEVYNRGFFAALDHSCLALNQTVYDAYKTFIANSTRSLAGSLLWKAFMIVGDDKIASQQWQWEPYMEAAIVTPLHPVLLEMMRHQYSFLCNSFCYYVDQALQAPNEKLFAERYWYRITDLATMQWPVLGTLVDYNQTLNTNVKSFGYIHLVGIAEGMSSFLNSRLLFEFDDEEDDFTDDQLFQETQASALIKQILDDYQALHPFAQDGLTIGAYCGLEVQPIIAGIDSHLADFLADREEPFALSVNIFSDSKDDSAVMRWLNAWKERWQQAELSSGMKHYSNCRISIAYRVVSREDNAEQFKRLLKQTEMDIMIFSDFIDLMGSRFEPIADGLYVDDYRRFPVLEKVCCKKSGGGQDYKRERVLSNQRFQLGSIYTEVMVRLKNKHANPEDRHVVISYSDFYPWVEIIDEAHAHSNWVVCIDPSVDEQLILKRNEDTQVKREIVGFGSGVGSHGENNFTVSTEHFSLFDIGRKISSYIASLFAPLEQATANAIADSLLRETLHIAGLSVVKATGPMKFVREFIANALVRKLLPRDPNIFCDEIFSLDAFTHWFDDPYDRRRPDLIRLKCSIVNGYFNIEAQLIECKLAQQSEGYLQEAREQIEKGLRELIWKFKPRQGDGPIGIFDPPNQRYWWMQLHRLVASKGKTNMPQYNDTLLALERLGEGCFNITWQAAVVAIWTDLGNDECNSRSDWEYSTEGQSLDICVTQIGREFLQRACLDNQTGHIFVSNKSIYFEFTPPALVVNHDDDDEEEVKSGLGGLEPETASGDSTPLGNESTKEKLKTQVGGDGKPTIPDRIMLGQVVNTNRDIYWEFGHKDLPNRHLLIFGASGTGKTYAVQAIILELAKYFQNSLIVDYTNGFTTNQLETIIRDVLKPQQHIIRREPLPINPFRQQCDVIEGFELPEDPATTAQRVSGVFAEIYQLGDQQKSALYTAIRDGVNEYGDSLNLAALMQRLRVISNNGGPTAASAASVITKIQPFVDTTPFGVEDPKSWEKLFSDTNSRCHIIQLAGFMKEFARLITEFALIDLYRYYRAQGDKDNPKVVVLDEIQNLDHRLESPLGQILTEGRKFGLSLVLATQTLSNLGKDERDRLFQASHKLFFKPADTEIRTYAGILADATEERSEEWVRRLASLKRGECYSLGFALNERTGVLEPNKWFKIKITGIENRVTI
jgi:DNA phosphorothioation-dependent restriction protein DptH